MRSISVSNEEVLAMARRAGLNLSSEEQAHLHHAAQHIQAMLNKVPRERNRQDDIAGTLVVKKIPHE